MPVTLTKKNPTVWSNTVQIPADTDPPLPSGYLAAALTTLKDNADYVQERMGSAYAFNIDEITASTTSTSLVDVPSSTIVVAALAGQRVRVTCAFRSACAVASAEVMDLVAHRDGDGSLWVELGPECYRISRTADAHVHQYIDFIVDVTVGGNQSFKVRHRTDVGNPSKETIIFKRGFQAHVLPG